MKNILKIAAVAAVAAVITTTVQATPITGVIGFAGTATLDQGVASSSTEVLSWGNNSIGLHTGTFSTLTPLASVALASPWFFNSGAKNNFWVVTDATGTYTFNLSSSSVFSTGSNGATTSISIFLSGTVVSSVLGLDPTAFTGSMTIQDPSVNNGNQTFSYTESISFNSVPDGGTTVLLLGSALSGLALIRRKLSA
jgi:uncharacterized membrane protein